MTELCPAVLDFLNKDYPDTAKTLRKEAGDINATPLNCALVLKFLDKHFPKAAKSLRKESGDGKAEKKAKQAEEAFITSTTAFVTPVVEIDGVAIADGSIGPLATRLRQLYIEEARKQSI